MEQKTDKVVEMKKRDIHQSLGSEFVTLGQVVGLVKEPSNLKTPCCKTNKMLVVIRPEIQGIEFGCADCGKRTFYLVPGIG